MMPELGVGWVSGLTCVALQLSLSELIKPVRVAFFCVLSREVKTSKGHAEAHFHYCPSCCIESATPHSSCPCVLRENLKPAITTL